MIDELEVHEEAEVLSSLIAVKAKKYLIALNPDVLAELAAQYAGALVLLENGLRMLSAENIALRAQVKHLEITNGNTPVKTVDISKILATGQAAVNKGAKLARAVEAKKRKKTSKAATDAQHDKVRKRHEAIREIWATGKYTTREICADEEYEALGMTRDQARKALRNTPPPSR